MVRPSERGLRKTKTYFVGLRVPDPRYIWHIIQAILADTRGGGGPTPFTNAFSNPTIGSLRYNTSQAGSPIFICYGTQRVSVNVVEGFGFTGSKGGKGGKGLGSSGGKKGSNQNYAVNVALALVQGPASFTGSSIGIGGNNLIWSNGGVAAGLGNVALNGYAGNDGQTPDPVFASADPNTPVIGYSGTCYVTGTPMQLGATPALPNISFEISGFLRGTCGTAYPNDANPSQIISDLLTNPRYGAGFPSGNLDTASFGDFGNYCQAAILGMSLLLDRQQPCARWVEEIAQLTVAAVVCSGALLKIVPYSDQPFSGNGATWTPALTAQYSLADSDFIDFGGGSDPVVITRSDPSQATNWLSIEYLAAGNAYNPQIIPVFDQSLIDRHGFRSEPSVQAHEFTNATSAGTSAQLMLQRKGFVRNTPIKFKLGLRHSRLEPMDIVELTDPNVGLVRFPVRITQIDEDDNGELTFTAEELPNTSFVLPVRQTTAGEVLADQLADPGNANAPIIFEPLRGLSAGSLEVWMIASGGPDWGGAQVWVSLDGSTYALAGNVYKGARQGVLTANLASHADPDAVNTLSVDLTQSLGQLISGTLADADNLVTLCYVDGELISYETATLTAAHKYDLTYLRRGAYGTVVGSHSIGSAFARFGPSEPSLFKYTYAASYVGQTIYIKLVSFNIFGLALQDISGVSATAYTLTGVGALGNYDVSFSYPGASPPSGTSILSYTFPQAVSFGTNLVGSVASASVAATASTTFNVAKNGVNFGTMVFAATATHATFAGSATSFATGDVLTMTPASTDATLAGISGFLAGES